MPDVPTRFVLFAFGEELAAYTQAHLALLTTMANAPAGCEFVVVTTHPRHFHWFDGRLRLVVIDNAQLTAWKGPSGFFWRTKIEAIRHAAALGPAHIVYLDSDVLATAPLADLCAGLAQGRVYMHQREFTLGGTRRRGHRPLRQLIPRTHVGTTVSLDTEMWNAGVVAVGAAQHGLLDRALALCDSFIADGQHTLHEQFAFSVALAGTGALHAAEPWILHYWGNKPGFQEAINAQLAAIWIRQLNVDQAIAFVQANPIRRPVSVRRRWWNRWFKGLAGVAS